MSHLLGIPHCSYRDCPQIAVARCSGCDKVLCALCSRRHRCKNLAWAACNCGPCRESGWRQTVIVRVSTGDIVWNGPG